MPHAALPLGSQRSLTTVGLLLPPFLHPAATAGAAAAEAAELKELVQQLQEQLSMKDKQLEGLQAAVDAQKAVLEAAYAQITDSMVKRVNAPA